MKKYKYEIVCNNYDVYWQNENFFGLPIIFSISSKS